MVAVYLFPLIITVIVLGGSFEAAATQLGCSHPDDRCLPIRHCPLVYKRIQKGELSRNSTFKKEVLRSICQPAVQLVKKTHICCPKRTIECHLDGKPGTCLLREQCPTLQSITEQQLMSSVAENLCYVHEKKNYFCCTDPLCVAHKNLCDQKAPTVPASAFPTCKTSNGTVGSLVSGKICSEQARSVETTGDSRVCCVPPETGRLISHPNAAKLARLSCGTNAYHNKIQNGVLAEPGEFPWMASLVYKTQAVCSGTLIHPSYVLTARHCINARLVKVRLGTNDLLEKPARCSTETCPKMQEITIAQSIRSHTHDVGLLRLVKPAELVPNVVWPICLPVYLSLQMYLPPMVTISGWGMTEKGVRSSVLLQAQTPVLVNQEGCTKDYMICAGGVDHNNHCRGDSGGPHQALSTYRGELRFVQYGIISDGPKYCNEPERPSRGVLVGYVMEWILDQMEL
ncbi:serine protease grass [Anopheles maculipalpis]|uniref:serine protease grass n=1 Tax=Anopheles maculipalpis TaxID=1496333 RepID=UPI002159030D|nr:serine protease grass [Anopheles maculipalpis]